MFIELFIPAVVLGLGLFVVTLMPKRGMVSITSMLFLFTLALFAVQSPSLAGFLTSAEAFVKASFPGTDIVTSFIFNGLRVVLIVLFAVTGLRALNAGRTGDSDWMELSKPPIIIVILVFGSDQIVSLIVN